MRRDWVAKLVIAGGLCSAMFGQQYPRQYPPDQSDPNDDGQYGNAPYGANPYGDPAYDANYQGVYAPPPPAPPPVYGYRRPPMPGPGYFWVDGYWNFAGGRYVWVAGFWGLPPYSGGYWVAPRYSSGRFFTGFWGGRRNVVIRNNYRYAPRPAYRAPGRSGFRNGDRRR